MGEGLVNYCPLNETEHIICADLNESPHLRAERSPTDVFHSLDVDRPEKLFRRPVCDNGRAVKYYILTVTEFPDQLFIADIAFNQFAVEPGNFGNPRIIGQRQNRNPVPLFNVSPYQVASDKPRAPGYKYPLHGDTFLSVPAEQCNNYDSKGHAVGIYEPVKDRIRGRDSVHTVLDIEAEVDHAEEYESAGCS